jgi:hypothetical protein
MTDMRLSEVILPSYHKSSENIRNHALFKYTVTQKVMDEFSVQSGRLILRKVRESLSREGRLVPLISTKSSYGFGEAKRKGLWVLLESQWS